MEFSVLGPVEVTAGAPAGPPQTRYVQAADGVRIAYQILGHGTATSSSSRG